MLKKLISAMFIFSFLLYAQSDSLQLEKEQAVEDLIDETNEETDNSDLYEEIEYFIDHPLNINSASLEDFTNLPYFNLSIAQKIIQHRNKYGRFFSVNEIYSIPGIHENLIRKSLIFLTVTDLVRKENDSAKIEHSSFCFTIKNRIIYDIQTPRGFKENIFKGSPYKTFSQFKANYGPKLTSGILMEKDAGETSYSDFTSGYLMISNWMNVSNIIIGDYIPKFGQGLALWSAFGKLKNSDKIYQDKKLSKIIKPYSSSTENHFFRGAAIENNWKHIQLTGFFSINNLDANLDSISGYISSVADDGLHRTTNEAVKKNSVVERIYGLAIKSDLFETIFFGSLYYNSQFNHPFYSTNLYDIKGDNFNYFSSYLNIYFNNIKIFGETTFDGKSFATFTSLNCTVTENFEYIFSVRDYSHKYINLHGYGFGEKTGDVNNEFGIYNGIHWNTIAGDLNLYFDQFKFPYSTHNNPLPSEGNELMVSLYNNSLKEVEFTIKFKHENKENSEKNMNSNEMIKSLKESFRADIVFDPSSLIRLKTRFEYVKYLGNSKNLEEGYLIYQDLRLKPLEDFIIYSRAAFFTTDSFNSAIYEYENGFTGILNSIGLYGRGVRIYIALRYNFIKKASLSLKYSETYKPQESSMYTGYSEIDGNIYNTIGIQLDIGI